MNKQERTKDRFVIPTKSEEDKMWNMISLHIKRQQKFPKIKRYALAATVLFILTVGSLMGYRKMVSPDIYMAQSTNIKINLKDGTTVMLLKGGRLVVEKSFSRKTRDVFLSGDAIFSVSKSKDHPFVVQTENYNTVVLGTIFKIIQRNKEFKVELYEGKVAVKKKNSDHAVFLTPNNTFDNFGNTAISTVAKSQKSIEVISPETKILDKKVSLSFDECKFKNAVEVIEKSYDIKIIFPEDFKDRNISLTIENAASETILQALAIYLNLKLNKNERNYQFEE